MHEEDQADHERYPFALNRGGITWGLDRELGDDEVACMFVHGGTIGARLWAEQEFPQLHDHVDGEAAGLPPGLYVVRARMWKQANLLMLGLELTSGGTEVDPKLAEGGER